MNYLDVSELVGKTLTEIKNEDNIEIIFTCDNGEKYKMFHSQDCCESVSVDDIVGDLNDLLNTPIIKAEEVSNSEDPKDNRDHSWTWTFYHLSTIKGHVTIKWYGESNGYYSETVDFVKI